jgi:hypothetical protein
MGVGAIGKKSKALQQAHGQGVHGSGHCTAPAVMDASLATCRPARVAQLQGRELRLLPLAPRRSVRLPSIADDSRRAPAMELWEMSRERRAQSSRTTAGEGVSTAVADVVAREVELVEGMWEQA